MPASYCLYSQQAYLILTYSGVLTMEDIVEVRKRVVADPEFSPRFNVIDDVSEVTTADINTEALMKLSASSAALPGVRRAFVVKTDLQRGMANMYRVFSESHGQIFKTFEHIAKAKEWILTESELV